MISYKASAESRAKRIAEKLASHKELEELIEFLDSTIDQSSSLIGENVIRPNVYVLANVGRYEVAHEIKGSTREEMMGSLRLALQQMSD